MLSRITCCCEALLHAWPAIRPSCCSRFSGAHLTWTPFPGCRSLLTQEGICMTLSPEFHFLEVAYPYVARRLLTDEDPALRERLFQVCRQPLRLSHAPAWWQALPSALGFVRARSRMCTQCSVSICQVGSPSKQVKGDVLPVSCQLEPSTQQPCKVIWSWMETQVSLMVCSR